jgi:2-methylcitrate dehydratase PrpD
LSDVTRRLAEFICQTNAASLPANVQREAQRAFLNIFGCMLGGARHDAVERTFKTLLPLSGGPSAPVIGRAETLGLLDAGMVNCQASAAHAFDDTHLATVIHPAGPIAGPLLAEAERTSVSGADFLAAFAIGVEVACRAATMLMTPPAEPELGWYMTGIACPIAAAASIAKLRGLSEDQTVMALGLAATESAGFRQTHGSMCTSLVPAQAARAGYLAALLAEQGVTATEQTLEGPRGFAEAFAAKPHLAHATDDLGERWEMLANMAKPYPCGIVIHPALDGCLEISRAGGFDPTAIARVELMVDPLCLYLCDRPSPPNSQLAQVSLQHWAAAALTRGHAGIPEGDEAAVADPDIQRTRSKITARADDTVGRDGAVVRVIMADGAVHERHIAHGLGSLDNPMSDADLTAKFLGQAKLSLSEAKAEAALAFCLALPDAPNAAGIAHASTL